jgi:hypothetical protein
MMARRKLLDEALNLYDRFPDSTEARSFSFKQQITLAFRLLSTLWLMNMPTYGLELQATLVKSLPRLMISVREE